MHCRIERKKRGMGERGGVFFNHSNFPSTSPLDPKLCEALLELFFVINSSTDCADLDFTLICDTPKADSRFIHCTKNEVFH